MIDDIQRLLEQYRAWLKDKTTLRQVDGWVEITTPFLDRHNDYLQIYVRREDHRYLITDGGYIIQDLRSSGCDLDTSKRKALLLQTVNGFGVRFEKNELTIRASAENFAMRKHNLVQAMLAVNDLFYLAVPVVGSLFLEDVAAWLDLAKIRYTPQLKFSGVSGYDHVFDFVIPKSAGQPERILKAINQPSRDTAEAVAFAWVDTKQVRPPNSRAYAILNDSHRPPPPTVLDALANYDVHPVLWSERDAVREELAA
ncbi:MAG: DUF1829 domain-containing protein [Chloroflexi bacterium]|nr:DUF1829 domain-containing protein [Chloroflexota bacterium]